MRQHGDQDLYTVRPIADRDVDPAYSLVRSLKPDVGFADWRVHVAEVRDQTHDPLKHGMRVLVGPHDYIYGLFSYRIVRNLGRGRLLQLDDFCVMPITGRRSASGPLLAEADALADRHNCRTVAVNFLDDEIWSQTEEPHREFGFDGSFFAAPPAVMKTVA